MDKKPNSWVAILIVVINCFWQILEFGLVVLGIVKLHHWKTNLDSQEPYDSTYISYVILYLACLLIGACLLVIILEGIANFCLFRGLHQKLNSPIKAFIGITTVITILSLIGLIIFNIYDGYYLFEDSIKYKLLLIILWASKIVYSIISLIFIAIMKKYVVYNQTLSVDLEHVAAIH